MREKLRVYTASEAKGLKDLRKKLECLGLNVCVVKTQNITNKVNAERGKGATSNPVFLF